MLRTLLIIAQILIVIGTIIAVEIVYKEGLRQGIETAKYILLGIALLLLFCLVSIALGWIYWGGLRAIFSH